MTNETQKQEQKRYPLSLDETLKVAEKVSWRDFNNVPAGFPGSGFNGNLGDADVRLSGEYMEITASIRSAGRYFRSETFYFAKYQHKRFGEIYEGLVEGERRSVERQKRAILDKLKISAKK